MREISCLRQGIDSKSKPLIVRRRILIVISALAAIAAVGGGIRETRAATDARIQEPRQSHQTMTAPPPEVAPGRNAASPKRPSKTPQARTQPPPVPAHKPPVPTPPAESAAADSAPPPASSACQQRLTSDVAVMHPLPSISGPNSCGAEDAVRLEAVVL